MHVPGRDPVPDFGLLRKPYPMQAHAMYAAVKALKRQKVVLLGAQQGSGKSLMSAGIVHHKAGGRPYRALVMCPGHLIHKTERELRETIPGVQVTQLESWRDLLRLDRRTKPTGSEWFVIGKDRAKLGACWQPAFVQPRGKSQFLRCPDCGRRLVDANKLALAPSDLAKTMRFCKDVLSKEGEHVKGCGAALWQMNRKINRYEPALFIKRHLKGYFGYLVLDESHQLRGAESAQGNASGSLISACRKVIEMTGTISGGLSDQLRATLFRAAPRGLIQEGLGWKDATAFNERYGKIETRVVERDRGDDDGEDNRMSRGKRTSKTKKCIPGIMPELYARHLVDKVIFLTLDDVAGDLLPLEERTIGVPLDAEQARAYRQIERRLRDKIKDMVRRGDKRLLSAMLQTLLAYPDHPFGWSGVGYKDKGSFVTVCTPDNLDEKTIRPKEQALIDLCRAEKEAGRQVWVFLQNTETYDVQGRLEQLLKAQGFRVAVLKSSVVPAKREAWIAKHAPKCDVIISHPKLVETGLDLLCRKPQKIEQKKPRSSGRSNPFQRLWRPKSLDFLPPEKTLSRRGVEAYRRGSGDAQGEERAARQGARLPEEQHYWGSEVGTAGIRGTAPAYTW